MDFFILLVHNVLLSNCIFEVSSLRDLKLWQVVLGTFKGHTFIIVSVKESKFLDYCPLTLKVKSLQYLVVRRTIDPTMQCHFPADLNLGKVNSFHEFLFFPLDALSYIF
jgi:hypothetical protein